MNVTRILVADDHPAFRDAVELYLTRDLTDTHVQFVDSLDSIAILSGESFSLILMDWFLSSPESGGAGIEALQRARVTGPVAVMTGSEDAEVVFAALSAGVVGFLPKTLNRAQFVAAVRLLLAGGTLIPVHLAMGLLDRSGAEADEPAEGGPRLLTERESEVLRELRCGGSNKEIGRILGMQEVTVKLHIRRILKKLDAKNRTDAVVKAQELGLLRP